MGMFPKRFCLYPGWRGSGSILRNLGTAECKRLVSFIHARTTLDPIVLILSELLGGNSENALNVLLSPKQDEERITYVFRASAGFESSISQYFERSLQMPTIFVGSLWNLSKRFLLSDSQNTRIKWKITLGNPANDCTILDIMCNSDKNLQKANVHDYVNQISNWAMSQNISSLRRSLTECCLYWFALC